MDEQHDFPRSEHSVLVLDAALEQLTRHEWIIDWLAARFVGAEDAAEDEQRNQHRRDDENGNNNALPDRQPFQWLHNTRMMYGMMMVGCSKAMAVAAAFALTVVLTLAVPEFVFCRG